MTLSIEAVLNIFYGFSWKNKQIKQWDLFKVTQAMHILFTKLRMFYSFFTDLCSALLFCLHIEIHRQVVLAQHLISWLLIRCWQTVVCLSVGYLGMDMSLWKCFDQFKQIIV